MSAPLHAFSFEPSYLVAPDVAVLALRTPTLPPALTTNTIIAGARPLIVDPATPHPAERDTLLHAIADLSPQAIVLTHHHHDHVGAAAWLASERGLPIWAHARTAELLAGTVTIDRHLAAGDVIDGWVILHTPGHASGHIVLHDAARGLLIVGDMVATTGTIIVDPPDGHMASYLSSLRLLRELAATALIPAHGAPIHGAAQVHAHLTHYIDHRLAREALVHATLSDAPRDLVAITRAAYPDLPPALLPLACRSALAHLENLAEDGRATKGSGGWSLA